MANNKNKKNESNKSNKRAKRIGVLVLGVVLFVVGGLVGYGSATHFTFKSGNQTADDNIQYSSNDSMLLSDVDSNGLKMSYSLLSVDEYEEYGIDARGIKSVYTATVTLENHDTASYKDIDLSLGFVKGDQWNNWIPGKVEEDYIKLSKDRVLSGEQFTIRCTEEFGAPILIKASAYVPPEFQYEPSTCSIQADYLASFGDNLIFKMGLDSDNDGIFDDDSHIHNLILSKNWNSATGDPKSEYKLYMLNDENYSANEIILEFTYGIGTIFEDISSLSNTLSIFVERHDERGRETFTFNSGFTIKVLNNKLLFYKSYLGYDFSETIESDIYDFGDRSYSALLSKFKSNYPICVLNIQFTSPSRSESYNYQSSLLVNPQYLYVPGQSPSFDDGTSGGIIF